MSFTPITPAYPGSVAPPPTIMNSTPYYPQPGMMQPYGYYPSAMPMHPSVATMPPPPMYRRPGCCDCLEGCWFCACLSAICCGLCCCEEEGCYYCCSY
ncbi:hypothetical protein BC940DRAFT_298694 [Gongronella butleri]|nr:hypothetical protein BC940DRAFT_298694 [Gongronella butleri]